MIIAITFIICYLDYFGPTNNKIVGNKTEAATLISGIILVALQFGLLFLITCFSLYH